MRLFFRFFFFAIPVCLTLPCLAVEFFFPQAKSLDLRRCHTKKKGKKDPPKKIRLFFICMIQEGGREEEARLFFATRQVLWPFLYGRRKEGRK